MRQRPNHQHVLRMVCAYISNNISQIYTNFSARDSARVKLDTVRAGYSKGTLERVLRLKQPAASIAHNRYIINRKTAIHQIERRPREWGAIHLLAISIWVDAVPHKSQRTSADTIQEVLTRIHTISTANKINTILQFSTPPVHGGRNELSDRSHAAEPQLRCLLLPPT